MRMLSLLDSIIDNHGGAQVVSQNDNASSINWVRGMSDPGEMIACGAYQQLRRHANESDDAYQARLIVLLKELPEDVRTKIETAMRAAALKRASLNTTNGRIAFASARVTPWHGLGTIVDRAMTSAEAIRLASLNWNVEKLPMSHMWQGKVIEAKDTFALVRGDTGAKLGTVGGRYQPIQNADAFSMLDTVLSEHGAKYETAGALYNGEKIFLLAQFPEKAFHVNGDAGEIMPYVALFNPHDGSGCGNVFATDVRIECANTLRTARGTGKQKALKIRHTGDVRIKVRDAQAALGIAVQSFDEFRITAETLAIKTIEKPVAYFNGVLDVVLEMTSERMKAGFNPLDYAIAKHDSALDLEKAQAKYKSECENRKGLLEEILERHATPTNGNGDNSAWHCFNAVTETADHRKPGRNVGTQQDQRSRRFESILSGDADELKQAALTFAMKA